MNDYDVVIVGARAAGAATARLLAQSGLDVLVLDRLQLPADTVSTHALMLPAVVQLRRWGLLDAVAATGATAIEAVDMKVEDTAFTAPVKRIGGVERLFAPRRIVLDALVLDAARAAGAEVRTGVTVTGVRRAGVGRVCGVEGTTADGVRIGVNARWVVGADGVRSTMAGLFDARLDAYAAPTNSCHYAYWSGLTGNRYRFSFAPGMGAGAIPTDAGLTCVFVINPAVEWGEFRRQIDDAFRRRLETSDPALAALVAQGRRETGYRAMRGLPGYVRTPVGPGWLLVGDAGYHRDPVSAHGITDAFRDAEFAARAIVDAAGDPRAERSAMQEYHRRRDDFALPSFAAVTQAASYNWSSAELLDLLAVMGDENEREARYLADLPALAPLRSSGAA
jgi:flavin-dependent dehydrogenase